mmetsp:Transcript_22045/g.39050  ORF Transcript_22045/g.39050 Transcript_22045/m.39050 type:complete len:219 (+) Transcript_22045:1237-1893(+)
MSGSCKLGHFPLQNRKLLTKLRGVGRHLDELGTQILHDSWAFLCLDLGSGRGLSTNTNLRPSDLHSKCFLLHLVFSQNRSKRPQVFCLSALLRQLAARSRRWCNHVLLCRSGGHFLLRRLRGEGGQHPDCFLAVDIASSALPIVRPAITALPTGPNGINTFWQNPRADLASAIPEVGPAVSIRELHQGLVWQQGLIRRRCAVSRRVSFCYFLCFRSST